MRKKFGYSTLPTLYFRNDVLSVPGYAFEKAVPWKDTGSTTLIAEGSSLKDGGNVLAKIAPAQTNGSICLEREAHILSRMAEHPTSSTFAVRMIEFFTIPKASGDCVVLLLSHPGLNILGRYLPKNKVNDILLAEGSKLGNVSSHTDLYMMGIGGEFMDDDLMLVDEIEAFDVIDLASFLEFTIQAAQCLEAMHKCGFVHREVRANAFHMSSHSGRVRFVHFGNRSISLETLGSPSTLVIGTFGEAEKLKVKEALCYLAPEQTSSTETQQEDHRTDLYSLGILCWTLLVGRGQMPFEGGPLEVLHSIVQKRPMPVNEVRRDVPQVLSNIVDKLLAKNPDARYQSAIGLREDLMECQRRLLVAVSSASDPSAELIAPFEIGKQDRFLEFTIPNALFGREKELDIIRHVIRNSSISFSRHIRAQEGFASMPISGSTGGGDQSETASSSSAGSPQLELVPSQTPVSVSMPTRPSSVDSRMGSTASQDGEKLRKAALRHPGKPQRTKAVFLVGPPGVGKSSMVLVNQAKWRAYGLWGQAKCQNAESAPFAALLTCLSSVLRQLMVFHTDVPRFVKLLKEQLGPQLQNLPLLYHGTPELQDILEKYDMVADTPPEHLSSHESRARFHTLVESVFSVISETRMFALFLDDLHEADESTMDLLATLLNSRSRMLIFATIRSDKVDAVERVRSMFTNRSRPTWINVESLSYSSISALVSKTLRRNREDCATLSRFIFSASSGNPFAARQLLTTLHRQRLIQFHWEINHWSFDMEAIEQSMGPLQMTDPDDLSLLTAHLRELPDEARKYIIWAAFFGPTFKITEVALMMDWEDSSGSSGSDEDDQMWDIDKAVSTLRKMSASSRGSVRGQQIAISEGWLIQRARDMCSFAHDRYWMAAQAEVAQLPEDVVAKMSFRIVVMMLHDSPIDAYRIAEHSKKCLPILHEHARRQELFEVLMDAGELAWDRGAHAVAFDVFTNARSLLRDHDWSENPGRTLALYSRLAALSTLKGDCDTSNALIQECLENVENVEEKARLFKLRSVNHFTMGNPVEALDDTMMALNSLDILINTSPPAEEVEAKFEEMKRAILMTGFDEVLNIPVATEERTQLIISLLNDAALHSYWDRSRIAFSDVLGLATIDVSLRSGMAPGSAVGMFWAIESAAEKRGQYNFTRDLAHLALRIAEKHGNNMEKCRSYMLFVSIVSGYDTAHLRDSVPRLQTALQHGSAAGDSTYACFSYLHLILTRIFIGDHLSEVRPAAEEALGFVTFRQPQSDNAVLMTALVNFTHAMTGFTDTSSADTIFDTDQFNEKSYLDRIAATSRTLPLVMNWYYSFKVVCLFCFGFIDECAELGMYVYETRDAHPNHRHIRYALFFHSLALIAALRTDKLTDAQKTIYKNQFHLNHAYIGRWLACSPVNNAAWMSILDAELASLENKPETFQLYDIAVRNAVDYKWPMEEGWALYLQGSHFVRCRVEGLGSELQRRGVQVHAQWGAVGIVRHLESILGPRTVSAKRAAFHADVAIQTDRTDSSIEYVQDQPRPFDHSSLDSPEYQELNTLSASHLASILTWSKLISSDINLSSALQKLTEFASEISGAQYTCVAVANENGDYTLATSIEPPHPCQIHEDMVTIRSISDPLEKVVLGHVLNTKDRLVSNDASQDDRFSTDSRESPRKAIICLPIFGNRGQTFGALFLSSKYPFSQVISTMVSVLCQQASISIANALLFRSVQAGTRENLKMISAQKQALESARRSREEALKATKIKSNFLASMSHELRTPFSSFYGLLDLLGGTNLDPDQNEIVQTAKQSCELLLRIIDSILDYSKLEASALKLEFMGFAVENIIADCMELLLPAAAAKLELSFDIEANVPSWVYSDYARIRQVLMNLIGNAVKFTSQGFVTVTCSVTSADADVVVIKFSIQDTGIGLSASDINMLFMPFQQADNSSTRRFGGTGLGLSISRQLVQLMGGEIGVSSELNVGSNFWFSLPLKLFHSDEAAKSMAEIESLRSKLLQPQPPRVLCYSPSEATLHLLGTMLTGFNVISSVSLAVTQSHLQSILPMDPPLDFIILDDQSELVVDEVARIVKSMVVDAVKNTKIVHLYTPTTSSYSGHVGMFKSTIPGVVKMTKPPRTIRLLQTLAELKNLPSGTYQKTEVSKAIEDLTSAQNLLFGAAKTVLIAEDNDVARSLLIKQLERMGLKVTATTNGLEAIAEWESHPPGYFTFAMFDHHMPLCDGVEAAKRVRILENKTKAPVSLPIVALTADCQESTKQLCLSAGMNGFYSKPLKKTELGQLIRLFVPPSTSESTSTSQESSIPSSI